MGINKKYLFLIFLLLLSLNLFCDENIYINNNIGFSFNIPNNLKIIEDIRNVKFEYFILLEIYSFNDPSTIILTRYEKNEYINNIKNEVDEFINIKGSVFNNGSSRYFKYKGESIGFIRFSVGTDEYPNKHLIFINNDYLIRIGLYYYDKNLIILKRYPKYFKFVDYVNTATWKEPLLENCKIFYNLIKTKSKDAPQELIKLEEYFDEVIKSLELFDPKSIFYSPSVPNLRFRESPDLNGKFIRSLNQGEKLELIEKGKEETINNVKGTWVKVKTEKGEVGWCFDAYLTEWTDEVKKK